MDLQKNYELKGIIDREFPDEAQKGIVLIEDTSKFVSLDWHSAGNIQTHTIEFGHENSLLMAAFVLSVMLSLLVAVYLNFRLMRWYKNI